MYAQCSTSNWKFKVIAVFLTTYSVAGKSILLLIVQTSMMEQSGFLTEDLFFLNRMRTGPFFNIFYSTQVRWT